ncbi:hypothetical protein WAI453_003728 [Rhynchosporium graminicola]
MHLSFRHKNILQHTLRPKKGREKEQNRSSHNADQIPHAASPDASPVTIESHACAEALDDSSGVDVSAEGEEGEGGGGIDEVCDFFDIPYETPDKIHGKTFQRIGLVVFVVFVV